VTSTPSADRPYMPGYGIRAADEGTGLLPWTWAIERLVNSHDYWLATARPDGEPHLMPVWAVWMADALWFSCGNDSRKTRNLCADGRCSLATDDATAPVVVQGIAEVVADLGELRDLLDAENAKYGTDYGMEMLDPALNTCFKVRPTKVIGLDSADFTGSPTRWSLSG
jgi:PPOX class probable F420-dependent enzyme